MDKRRTRERDLQKWKNRRIEQSNEGKNEEKDTQDEKNDKKGKRKAVVVGYDCSSIFAIIVSTRIGADRVYSSRRKC